jgi:6-phosphogluconolactonase/glucosamine-6-phosphate isomerase/deaminase
MIDALLEHDLPWSQVAVWQVDERVAPHGDAARNALQLGPLQELPCRVWLMPVTAGDLRAAARRYAASLPERFDVVHLGIGSDGHTASWPPGRDHVWRSHRDVEITDVFNGWRRMTLTGTVVNRARGRIVLATGAAKQPVVERWLLDDHSLPVSAVRRSRTWVFLDVAAAPQVPLH